jgi:hypothetical protein
MHTHTYIYIYTHIHYVPTYTCICAYIHTYITYTHTYMHTHTHTYIHYVSTYTCICAYIHTYIRTLHTHIHICIPTHTIYIVFFSPLPKASSTTTPEITPRPLPIRYYTDKVPFDVTQHEVLAASLNKLQTRHSRLFPAIQRSVNLHCRLSDKKTICYITFVLILIPELGFSDVNFN